MHILWILTSGRILGVTGSETGKGLSSIFLVGTGSAFLLLHTLSLVSGGNQTLLQAKRHHTIAGFPNGMVESEQNPVTLTDLLALGG